MYRRSFLKSLAVAPVAGLVRPRRLDAALPKAKITKVNIYEPPNVNRLFNQSNMLVTVETDIGITGIGEGGARDTLEQCAGNLIGQNPFQIERLWQRDVHLLVLSAGQGEDPRSGRHGPGAVGHQGQGAERCRSTRSWAARSAITWSATPPAMCGPRQRRSGRAIRGPESGRARRATMEAGYRCLPHGCRAGRRPDRRQRLQRPGAGAPVAAGLQSGTGRRRPNGDFMIDFHQRFDFADALRCCRLIEEYEPVRGRRSGP